MDVTKIAWDEIPEEDFGNGIYRKVLHGTNITLAYIRLKPGSVVKTHNHPNEQVTSVLRGGIKVEIDGEEFEVKQGETIVIPPDLPHRVTSVEASLVLDAFSPPRNDWKEGVDAYLRS